MVEGKRLKIAPDSALDIHQRLAQYSYSSYHYYRRKYGKGFLADAWMRFPIPDYFERDSF